MTTLTNEELKDSNVIAELNTKIANKKIDRLRIYKHDSLLCSLNPSALGIILKYDRHFGIFRLVAYNPYLHILLTNIEFSLIEITEVD